MKKVILLVVGLLCMSGMVLAGEVITNDTDEDAIGFRVVFSSPVLITGFGDVLRTVDPEMLSYEFVFSGGTVEPWGSHWFSYIPATAYVMEYEWLTEPASAEISPTSPIATDQDEDLPLWMRNPNPTYEEIMAEIAVYPGPDEPLYEPALDEAIWLTDLEGHADIYDNDSIKINYANWFDKSQISRTEIRRNGIKMRFLPDMFDVLTNKQMKTFDGNPLEHTPASNQTDHAIFGYEYEFRIFGEPALKILTATIVSPVHYTGEKAVNVGIMTDVIGWPESQLVDLFQKYPEMGFETIQFGVAYFMHSVQDNDLFSLRSVNPSIHPWARTLTELEIRKILRVIDAVGLKAELRLEIWISEETRFNEGETHRGALRPRNADEWFENYGDICVCLATILEEEGGDIFTPIVELSRTETHGAQVEALLARIDDVLSGRLCVSTQAHTHIACCSTYDLETDWSTIARRATFWSYPDLEIGLNWGASGAWENQNDQRLSVMIEKMVEFWAYPFQYYATSYPDHEIRFAEVFNPNFDGSARGYDYFLQAWNPGSNTVAPFELDNQEDADIWAAYIIAAEFLEAAGISVFSIVPYNWMPGGQETGDAEGDTVINDLPSERCVVSMMGGSLVQAVAQASVDQTGIDWDQVPIALRWSRNEHPSHYFDNGTTQKPLSAATHWGEPGSNVSDLHLALYTDVLAVCFNLHKGDSIGDYVYTVTIANATETELLHVFLNPQGFTQIAYDAPGFGSRLQWGGNLAVDNDPRGLSSYAAVIPLPLIRAFINPASLSGWVVSASVDHYSTDGRELFLLRGDSALESFDSAAPML